MATGRELTTTPFPNTTTLFGWNINGSADYVDGDFVGGKALTENGVITAGDNHFGVSTFCQFDGSDDYLTSDDVAFGFTADASVGFWIYRASWAAISAAEMIINKWQSGEGWTVQMDDALDTVRLNTNDGGFTSSVAFDFTFLSAGWHHFVFVRDAGVNGKIYMNGILKITNTDVTDDLSTSTNDMTIARLAGSTTQDFTGRLADLFIHVATALSDNEVRAIYLWSWRRRISTN